MLYINLADLIKKIITAIDLWRNTGWFRDKQQSPTVEHRELYSVSCTKPQWKNMKRNTEIILNRED